MFFLSVSGEAFTIRQEERPGPSTSSASEPASEPTSAPPASASPTATSSGQSKPQSTSATEGAPAGDYGRAGFFLDIALAYALINFIATIAVLRYIEIRAARAGKQEGGGA